MDLSEALGAFIRWLKYLNKPLLWAHNNRKFDSRVLWSAIEKCHMTSMFCDHMTGFVDTLPLSREMLPSRRSYSQSDLVDELLQKPYAAHNSLADSRALKNLMEHLKPSNELIAKYSFSIQEVASNMAKRKTKQKNIVTLEPLVVSDIVTKYMADKMAASGIDYSKLEHVYQTDRKEGIKNLLSGAGEEEKKSVIKPKVLESLCEYFKNILELD